MERPLRILTVIGARPQIIKAAAISRAIATSFPDRIEETLGVDARRSGATHSSA